MLVTKKKHDLLIKNYNELVDDRDTWKEAYNESKQKLANLEKQCNRLYKELDKAHDEVLDLKLEYEECWQKFIKTRGELTKTDEVVLQYEQRINELEEQLNETTI